MTTDQTSRPLGMLDARILALESGPIRGHTLKVLVVEAKDRELSVEELRAQISERLPAEPHWTERLVTAPHAPSKLAWQADQEFDIGRHVDVWPAEEPVDDVAFDRCIADIMKAPLDRSGPLWRVDVIPRLADGRSAVVWKVHHRLADGVTMMRTGRRLLWTGHGRHADLEQVRGGAPGAHAQVAAGARLLRVVGYRGLMIRDFLRVWGLTPLAGEVGPERIATSVQCRLTSYVPSARRLARA